MSPSLVSQFRGSHWYGVGKSVLALGPWSEGINSETEPELMSPQALMDCINYIIRPGGALYQRPSAVVKNDAAFDPTTHDAYVLGSTNGVFGYFASVDKSSNQATIYRDVGNGSFTSVFGGSTIALSAGSVPLDIFLYNSIYYITTSKDGIWSAVSTTTALTQIATSVLDTINKTHILKDRFIQVSGATIYWSKATDPTIWAAPDGGFVDTFAEDGGGTTISIVFQDAIYIFKQHAIWRLSWTNDPSIDAVLERLTDEVGGFNVVIKNNELVFCNFFGVYSFISGYVRELSLPIRTMYRDAARDPLTPAPGINLLDDLIIVGPLNRGIPARDATEVTDPKYGNHYFIYDINAGIWYRWQFSAGYGSNSVSGPVGKVIAGQGTSSSDRRTYYWAGNTQEGRPLVAMHFTSDMISTFNSRQVRIYDVARNNNNRLMGQRFATSWIISGDNERFKRLFGGLIDAIHTLSTAGSIFRLSVVTDAGSTDVDIVPQAGKIAWGKSFRFRKLQLVHDTLTGIDPSTGAGGVTELQDIRRITLEVRASREETVAS